MSDLMANLKKYKRLDIYENKEQNQPLDEERSYYIQNKMMKFYKIIRDKENPYYSTLFMSDNKGEIYMCEFIKDNKITKITNFGCICNDSKYILVDIIKSTKYDFFFSLNLNPCLNIFKIKNNIKEGKKEIEVLQHINLKDKKTKSKYNKLFEFNSLQKDYLIIFGEEKIELLSKDNSKDIVNYQKVYTLKYDKNNNGDNFIENKISNVFQIDDERLVLFNKGKLELIIIKINELVNKKNNKNSTNIEIINKINIKGVKGQFERISSFFIDKDYIFLGLSDSLVLVSVAYGEIIQTYKIGKVIRMKIINEQKDIVVFAETNEDEFYFIKYKFVEYYGLIEENRIKYDKWFYKFDVIQNGEIIAIYDVKGLITLLKYEKLN